MHEQGTWLHWLYSKHLLSEHIPEMVPETLLVVIIMCLFAVLATRKLRLRNPSRFQAFLEFIVTSLDNFIRGIVGDEARSLTPIIGTIFIFILSLNLLGLIPGFTSPTANINTTVALALSAFAIVQFYGFKNKGIGYVKHFLGEPIWLAPLMLPIHLIGELARPLSLSVRLFGNIFGEDKVIVILVTIVMSLIKAPWWAYTFVPAQFPMMLFAIFTSFVQALVFSMLVSIYIAVAIADHEEEHAH